VFWRKRVFDGGFLMVNLWWKCGDLWCVDGRCLDVKVFPLFLDLFSGFPFWNGEGSQFTRATFCGWWLVRAS
jgi:hypothetical protein